MAKQTILESDLTLAPTDSTPKEIAVLPKHTIIESGLKVDPADSLPMEITDGETVTQSNLDIPAGFFTKGSSPD